MNKEQVIEKLKKALTGDARQVYDGELAIEALKRGIDPVLVRGVLARVLLEREWSLRCCRALPDEHVPAAIEALRRGRRWATSSAAAPCGSTS